MRFSVESATYFDDL